MPTRRELANAIRFLSIDAVQKANSGHPGMPMGMADIAEVLWNDFLKFNPLNPNWQNRDRFVISNGHGSMLLYALLHLAGYPDMTLDEIKHFRQLHSKTAGHPEYGLASGIETTTGPLGQGISNAVGMALAERILAAQFNRPGFEIVNNYTYAFLGDGCLMEGISHESCSLAGHWGLGKLIAFWDDNGISIDGKVAGWFSDDTPKRFEAYGWNVIQNVDGHNAEAIKKAIIEAQKQTAGPTLICCKTDIAFGSPNYAGSHEAHGAALGDKEVALTRENLKWPYAPFEIPQEIYAAYDAREKGVAFEFEWQKLFESYQKQFPELAKEYLRRINQTLPVNWEQASEQFIYVTQTKNATIASRKASQECLTALGAVLPELLGGSADLTGSNLTAGAHSKPILEHQFHGNYIYYGVREFGMSAIMNGIALYRGFIPYGGTFLTFADYARNAVRLSALMKQRVIYVYTHDSIGLGEDGPTHQPIEHAAMLRMTPNLSVWRPADAVETAVAWKAAIEKIDGPTTLLLSRQNLDGQVRTEKQIQQIAKGGYILFEPERSPQLILIATGSEVMLAMSAAKVLEENNIYARVVSMPATDVFDQQAASYRESVLPIAIEKRIAIEAGVTTFWYKYVGSRGKVIGMDTYGESAPAKDLFNHFGFTVEHIVNTAKEMR